MGLYDDVPPLPNGHVPLGEELDIWHDLLSAEGPNGGLWDQQIVYKATTSPARISSTFVIDPDLQILLAASALYLIEMELRPAAITAALFKTTWQVPSGAAGNRGCIGPGSSATDTGADNIAMHSGVHGFGTTVTYGSRNSVSTQVEVRESGIVTTSTTSDLCALLWAQGTSNATGTVLGAGSWMRATRLA